MNTIYRRYVFSAACIVAALSMSWSASAQAPSGAGDAMQRAGQLMRQRDWNAAAGAYRDALGIEPKAPWTWYMLGTALHAAADYEGAIEAWEESIDVGITLPGVSHYNLACASARLGRSAQALDHLEKAAASAFYTSERFREDPDLESLRGDARFAEIGEAADLANHPCLLKPEYRQFDYWLGSWDVKIPAGFSAGASLIEKSADGCFLHQTWKGTFGLNGQSFTFYDPATEEWTQTWVGQLGAPATLRGGLVDGVMTLEGRAPGPTGAMQLTRTSWTPREDGTIRLLSESSSDDGATFDFVSEMFLVPAK